MIIVYTLLVKQEDIQYVRRDARSNFNTSCDVSRFEIDEMTGRLRHALEGRGVVLMIRSFRGRNGFETPFLSFLPPVRRSSSMKARLGLGISTESRDTMTS